MKMENDSSRGAAIKKWSKIPLGILPPGKKFIIHKEEGITTFSFDPEPKRKVRHDRSESNERTTDSNSSSTGAEQGH